MNKFSAILSFLFFLVLPLSAATQSPIRVNAAGSAYTDSKGHYWSGDYGFSSGSISSSAPLATVTGTTDPKLFKSARFGDFQYQFALINGTYQVNLYFAETSATASGKRVFDVQMQGVNAINSLDIYATVGKNHALVKSSTVSVTGGKLVIRFVQHIYKDNPIVSAIEILPSGTTSSVIAPSISTQPINQTVIAGQTATFKVVANGTSPFSYQWQKNGIAISGATSAGYTTPATLSGNSGETFRAIVSNSKGSVTSSSATLTVSSALLAPAIISQPVSLSVPAGQSASFAVVASGTSPLTYQWLKNGYSISGATNASYTLSSASSTDNGTSFSVVLTNPAGKKTSNAAKLSVSTALSGNTVAVNGQDIHQQIDGFGASSAATGDGITDSQADLFWSTTRGVGLSLLRIQIQSDGTFPDIATMQKAKNRGAIIWGTPWSPPASMKTNGSVANGGSLIASDYQAWADYLAKYVLTLKNSYGFDLYALSVQNEPNWVAPYDSCIWTGQQFHDFLANNLLPTFSRDGIKTKIMLPEETGWFFGLSTATLSDANTAAGVSIIGAHNYDGAGASTYPLGQSLGKRLWETEVSTFDSFNGGIGNGLFWAQKINDWMTIANANAWHYWVLIAGGSDNGALLGPNGQTTKRLFVMGNFSKFVRPGYERIGVTASPVGGVSLSAYKDPSTGKFAIVAINHNGNAVTLNFSLSGLSAGSVTPWITDATRDLAPQSSIGVSGGAFTATLPASSVTTYVP